MKFMLNGAVTIGTLDGANIEIREEAGAENFFHFGLTAEEVERIKREGYRPDEHIEGNDELRDAMNLIAEGTFSRGDREVFRPLLENLRTARIPSWYWPTTRITWRARSVLTLRGRITERWTRMSILNTARSGKFSSDRSVREYCVRIWDVPPVKVALG